MRKIRRALREGVATRGGRLSLVAAFIVVTTVLVAALLRAEGQVATFGDGWWWSVRHLIDPGALGDDDTWLERLVGLAVTLSGLVIFVGVILEVLTEVVSRSLDYLNRATTGSDATGHVVFVGWSERLPEVIRTLADATALIGPDSWSREVVVLLPDTGGNPDELRARLRPRRAALHVQMVAAGIDDNGFALAACRAAQAIVVLRDETRLEDPVVQDLESVRRTLLLARHLGVAAEESGPAVFFEIVRAASIDAAARLVPKRFEPLVNDRLLSALLRDTVLEPAWSRAVQRLLDPRGPPSLAVVADPGFAGLHFGDLSARLDGAVAVAIVPNGEGDVALAAPPADTRLAPSERLVAVVGSDAPRLLPPRRLDRVEDCGPGDRAGNATAPHPVLIVGWNSKVPTYVAELAGTRGARFTVTSLSTEPAAARLKEIGESHAKEVDLHCLEGDPLRPDDLASAVEAAQPRTVMVTSTPVWGSASVAEVRRAADADAMVTVMHVNELVGGDVDRSVIVDLFEPGEGEAFREAMAFEILPSTAIFASIVTWMVIDPESNRFVESIFGARSLRRGSTVFSPSDGLARPFAAVHRCLIDHRQTPIGIATSAGLTLNPPADHPVNPGDRLLVIERLEEPTADFAGSIAGRGSA